MASGAGRQKPFSNLAERVCANREAAALAYVRAPDGRYHAVCLTVLSLDTDDRIVELTTFVLPELFAAWGFPAVLDV